MACVWEFKSKAVNSRTSTRISYFNRVTPCLAPDDPDRGNDAQSSHSEELDRIKRDLPLPDEISQPGDRLRDGKLHFPVNVDVCVSGLCVVCLDKSISRQFKTHYREYVRGAAVNSRYSLRQTYRLLARPTQARPSNAFFTDDGRPLDYGLV
ncbi:hypothetical protein FOZ63_025537, partial [Perkinsus olseni]